MTKFVVLWCYLTVFLRNVFFFVGVVTTAYAANDLQNIQQQIKQQEQKISQQQQEKSQLQTQLKQQEQKIELISHQLKQQQDALKNLNKHIQSTQKQISRLQQQEKEQKKQLEQLLDSAYRKNLQLHDLEKIFSADARNSDRMNTYYKHFNQQKIKLIQELKQTQQQLKQQQQLVKEQQQQQQQQISEQQKQQRSLQQVKNEHQSTLSKLNQSIAVNQDKLARLKENENRLRQEILAAERAAKAREQQELANLKQKQKQAEEKHQDYQPTEKEQQLVGRGNGLGAAKRQYAMPVVGKISNRFGSIQMGEIRWKGIVIQANRGANVRAIAAGKVILANRLQGYGLVIVIDHGKGDMSIYGYNSTLNVKNGDVVRAGEIIAQVGQSEDSRHAALYFEIRRQGTPINPTSWLK
ncbi:murein hydrolase activator EnvC [Gallibacterium trehalosifermentans]|uniref:Murein hydrolase activator EnvC n=1 Tax=Gallibacterium trehalosifermentans TaxID=516935 RepID=A0ABV6H222_9PAST